MNKAYFPLKFNLGEFLRIHKYRDALEALMWTLLTIPVAMIMLDSKTVTNFDLTNVQFDLKLVSRLTGLYATNLMLIQLIIISRNGFLNYLYGHDKLTAFHKKLGKPVYILLVVHFCASIFEYMLLENKTFVEEFFALFKYEDLAFATFSFMLFTVIVFTSLNTIRKFFPYEIWYFVHIFAYAAVLLSFPHQINMGTDFKDNWIATGYWWGLYFTALIFIVLFRFMIPLYTSLRHGLKVSKVERESDSVVSIYMTGKNLDKLEQNAGQFYMWKFLTLSNFFQTNPFSISCAPNKDFLRVTVSDLGNGSHSLQKVKVGTRVMVDGPYGIFTENRRLFKDVTLIAAGVGITPVRSLVEDLEAKAGDITVIYRGDRKENMPLVGELESFVDSKGINLHLSVGKRAFPTSWLAESDSEYEDSAALMRIAPNVVFSDVYVCGPIAWTKAVEKTLLKVGVAKEQIHIEEFAW